jgi:asparagine synthase (glutamine-hydrolysing)
MCSILGLVNFKDGISISQPILEEMGKTLGHRGPDQNGFYRDNSVCFQHNRLAVIDVENGLQPMTATFEGNKYTIVYNGEIYNANELRNELISMGVKFQTRCDTEVVLYSYIIWGMDCSSRLNGIYAFAVYNESKQAIYLSRDRMGVKPFFYVIKNDIFIFASEIKALLAHQQVKPEINIQSIAEIMLIGPGRTPGYGVFKQIKEKVLNHEFSTFHAI